MLEHVYDFVTATLSSNTAYVYNVDSNARPSFASVLLTTGHVSWNCLPEFCNSCNRIRDKLVCLAPTRNRHVQICVSCQLRYDGLEILRPL